MEALSAVIGFAAVSLFLLSYQMKRRSGIIIMNTASRVLYIIQYILLGAFEGAVLDVLGAFSAIIASRKDKGFIARHTLLCLVLMDTLIIGAGIYLYEDAFSLFPIVGVLLHTTAFWINDERIIRRVSIVGSPFWLTYNFVKKAYGSAVGDVLSMVSIATAMIKYRKHKSADKEETQAEAVPEDPSEIPQQSEA
jgi:hypothetical protein